MNADTTVNTTVDTPATPAAAAVVATPKAPSKKSQADVIFANKMIERSQGLFASNRDFRKSVLETIEAELGVSRASASTMYNSAKKAAETADAAVGLGRDPKKEKPAKVEGAKRGRPVGSKNKAKEVEAVPAADATTEVVVQADAAPAEAAA